MPRRPARPLVVLLSGLALLASACTLPAPVDPGAGGGEEPPPGRAARSPARRQGPTWAGTTVRVLMNDRFRYRPDAIVVQAGRTVTFEVANVGKLPHEFVLGDRAIQLDHERQMQAAAGGAAHAHAHGPAGPGGLTVPPGGTRRLTWTFQEPGTVLYGCHVLGHWAAGMKGAVVVVAADRPLPAAALPGR